MYQLASLWLLAYLLFLDNKWVAIFGDHIKSCGTIQRLRPLKRLQSLAFLLLILRGYDLQYSTLGYQLDEVNQCPYRWGGVVNLF